LQNLEKREKIANCKRGKVNFRTY